MEGAGKWDSPAESCPSAKRSGDAPSERERKTVEFNAGRPSVFALVEF